MILLSLVKKIEIATSAIRVFAVAVIGFSVLLDPMQWLSLMLWGNPIAIHRDGAKESTF